jgi:hypothetical protein
MTVELDFELEEILNYDSTIISCIARNPISNNSIQTGFEVIGDKIYFYNSRANTINNPLLSLGLIEKKRLRISYVIEPKGENSPMCYIYLNGIMSAVTKYNKSEDDFHFAG